MAPIAEDCVCGLDDFGGGGGGGGGDDDDDDDDGDDDGDDDDDDDDGDDARWMPDGGFISHAWRRQRRLMK